MVKKFTVFKVLIALIILGIIAIPVTAVVSLPQIKTFQNPINSLTPGTINNNTGIITKSFTIYVYNPGFYDINSLILVTTILNQSLSPFGQPNFMLWYIPKGSIIPVNIAMTVNTTALNATGNLANFLNTTSFLGQTILDASYAYSLTGLSTMQITQLGPVTPMYNLTIGPGILTNTTAANITFGFANFLQSYPLNINASIYNGTPSTLAASGTYTSTVSSATLFSPDVFMDNITITGVGGGAIVAGTYSLVFTITSPFGYTYTNSTYAVG
jgi:hypothetical protein